jgi:FlaA1/EpsC-like NDP-sugar epimerase
MIINVAIRLLALQRPTKRLLALGLDALLCGLTLWLALCLRTDSLAKMEGNLWVAVALSLVLALPIFIVSGLYRAIFRYSGWAAMVAVMKAIGLYGVCFASLIFLLELPGVPRSMGLLQPMLLLLAVGASRAVARFLLSGMYVSHLRSGMLPKVLIYGAGSAGRQLAGAMANSPEMRVVGFLDDDARLHGQVLNGLQIYNPEQLTKWVDKLAVSVVLLAMPSTSRQRRNDILEMTRSAHVAVRTLPGMMDLAHGRVEVSDLRELELEDLLGRDTVPPNGLLLDKNVRGKVVLVTGAGGSIGSELCRQIVRLEPAKLLLVEQSEYALYAVQQDLMHVLADPALVGVPLVPLLASVRDEERMREIILTWQPQTIYHAAAYKHVPLVEHNAAEGVKNNVLGTWTTAKVAAEQGVSDFVLISTDKAVRPTNVMGASKRLAEMVLQALAAAPVQPGHEQTRKTRFSMVRFGNVLGSSGSVVPLFRKQIMNGGPITLTHADITRYFMTIPEAAQLVIQAGAMASGGDVFVLDMGEPVRIADLAKRMVELSGLKVRDKDTPDGDISIKITGLRPGEKLYEELLIGNNPLPTHHPRIMKANEDFLPWPKLLEQLQLLTAALGLNDMPEIRRLIKELVPGYQPEGEVMDWVYRAQMIDDGLEIKAA